MSHFEYDQTTTKVEENSENQHIFVYRQPDQTFVCSSHYLCAIRRLPLQESILCVNNLEQHRDSSNEYDLK